MRQSKDEKCIEDVIGNTFKAIQDAYNFQRENAPDLDNTHRQKLEFKANNASARDHKKDFVKLNNKKEGDGGVLRYFIEMVKSFDDGTLSSLHGKTKGNESMFRCWSLDKRKDITKDICSAVIKE